MRNRFLCLGECMVEIAPAENGLCQRGFAGDTFNTAWYARHLLPPDWVVSYGTVVGTDAVSDEMVQFMTGEGIDVSFVRRHPERTVGLYMISLSQGERSFSYWRSASAAKTLAENITWLDAITADQNVIHFSGITLAILAPKARKTLCAALAKARRAGTTVAFDTNLRPRLWASEVEMREGLDLGASVSDVVLPSFDEETALFGDRTPEDTIARYRAKGARIVAVKDGERPLTIWTQEAGTHSYMPPATSPVDTTAAGDSFAAGLLTALAMGDPLDVAADRAMQLASRVIQHPGALVPKIFDQGGQT